MNRHLSPRTSWLVLFLAAVLAVVGVDRAASAGSSGGSLGALASAITWVAGAGAIDHITGPSDQDLSLQAGTGRNLILADNGGTTQATVSTSGLNPTTLNGTIGLTGTLTGSSSGQVRLTNGLTFFEDFTNEVLDLNVFTVASDAGGTVFAIAVASPGTIAGICDTTTNDKQEIASEIIYSTSLVTYFETRCKVSAITTACVNIGLSDAKAEAAQTVAWTVGASDVLTTNTDDGVGFVFDTGADTDGFFGVVSASTDDKEGAGATAPVADTYIKLAFSIDASRLVTFYVNDVAYGSVSTALDASTLLCPYVAVQSRSNAARTFTIDYIYVWQKRT
jgi:hypothetical protein